jgi:branched-chain amino acid transport system permease protein
VLHAIRENKIRARFLGYDVNKYRVNAFVLSALFPAIAGWLWTYYQQSINPDASSVGYSGNIVMMSMLGGVQTFFGPILGSIVYWELQNNISQLTKYWEAWIGAVFVVFVLVGPRGIMGVIDNVRLRGVSGLLGRGAREELAEEGRTI